MSRLPLQEHIVDLGKESLSKGGSLLLRVVSDSMKPMLKIGDILTVKSATCDDIRCGDLIVFIVNHTYFTHRVLDINGEFIQTKGDWWHKPDPLLRLDAIIGVVQSREHDGRIINFEKNRWGRMNRVLGHLGRMQVRWLKFLDEDMQPSQATPNDFGKTINRTWLTSPFRLIERLLLFIWGYK